MSMLPSSHGPLPSSRQLAWHGLETYGFLHFTTNTFTDREWGYGDEAPAVFKPTAFDAEQIVSTAKDGGLRGLILTCKHHDGFCLWPSRFTEHSVKNSPWRQGRGDVVREIAEACRGQGLKFGVYLSPWDRNHAAYGTPAYVDYYRRQLRELLTDYGPIFEVWFDGANGGDGYYGGARDTRTIDKSHYYGWEDTFALVRQLQPEACMFSDVGPDIRWVGNENGVAGEPCWATYTPHGPDGVPPAAGLTVYQEGEHGHRDGRFWLPAEADVSIRPGWFWHAAEDDAVRSPENLLDLYFRSVGRGASLNLNLPPDRRGLIPERDAASLREFKRRLDRLFAVNLVRQATISASQVREGWGDDYAAGLVDGEPTTGWATDDQVRQASLTFDFASPVTVGIVDLREMLPLGQRIDAFAVDAVDAAGNWRTVASEVGIGARRLLQLFPVTSRRFRLRITRAAASPVLSHVGLHAPAVNGVAGAGLSSTG